MENKQKTETNSIDQIEEESILLEELERYNGIFSKEILEYLQSLTALELSALNEQKLSEDKMKLLNSIDLYRKIVVHNIFYNTCKMCQRKYSYLKTEKEYNKKSLHIQELYNGQAYDIFDFQCHKDNFSIIDLYETVDNTPKRKNTINLLQERISYLEEKSRLFNSHISSTVLELEMIKKEVETLEQRNSLEEDGNLYIASIQSSFLKDVLDLYGINEDDFKEKEQEPVILQPKSSTSLNKMLIKKYPHTTVVKNTKYY